MNNLKERLKKYGISQVYLSKVLGISSSYLSALLNKRIRITDQNIMNEYERKINHFLEILEQHFPIEEDKKTKEKKKITLKSKKKKLF